MLRNNFKCEPTSEDTVQCLIFSTASNVDKDYWECLSLQLNETIKSFSKGYIWHRDELKLCVPLGDNENDAHLVSNTCFGDNIEDEWYIVYVMLKITEQYNDIVVQITDSDGDFLLIEAANILPSWANPETTENRVFISKGHIHIIPPEIFNLDSKPTPEDAVKYMEKLTEQSYLSIQIEKVILERVGTYPDKEKENMHKAIIEIPVDIAALLTIEPKLIAPIICSYCNHDTFDVKYCKNMKFENCVAVGVNFTKCLYAMLTHSKLITSIKNPITVKNNKRITLGKKIACGYQIIMGKSSGDVFSTKEFNKFLNSLKENGYFKNNIEGSKEYNMLLEKSKEFFMSVECPVTSHVSDKIAIIQSTEEFAKVKEKFQCNSDLESNITEDNEDWLNIHPEQLNSLLNTRYGKQSKFKNNDVITPQVITSELTSFLKQTSDFEGIEVNENDKGDNYINFESDEFVNCIEKMLHLLSTNNENEDTDDDSDFNDDDGEVISQIDIDEELDQELKSKLEGDSNEVLGNDETILSNIVQSMKEERAASGPTSNLLKSLGVNKCDMLDSDDDDD